MMTEAFPALQPGMRHDAELQHEPQRIDEISAPRGLPAPPERYPDSPALAQPARRA
jgi:hypothetical protein